MSNQVETCRDRDRDCARVSKCGEGELDYQHVISMSLEKISSERRRRSGANLHRSLMICDLLVRLRARVLASEGSEVRPTVQPDDTRQNAANDDRVDAQPRADAPGAECDPLSQPATAAAGPPAQLCSEAESESRCDEPHADAPPASAPDAHEQPACQPAHELQLQQSDSNPNRSKSNALATCERRKRRRFSVAAEPNDADKRCRLVPESTNDPEDPSAYVSVSMNVVSSLGSNPVPHNVGSYILPSSSVLLNYPGQHSTQTHSANAHDSADDSSKHQVPATNSMPFVFVID